MASVRKIDAAAMEKMLSSPAYRQEMEAIARAQSNDATVCDLPSSPGRPAEGTAPAVDATVCDLPSSLRHPLLSAAPPVDATPSSTRLRLLDVGYAPVPANGKKPAIVGYTAFTDSCPTEDTVELWTRTRPRARNTGVICGAIRVIDIDVDDPKRAWVCRHVVERVVGGELPCRVGRWPRLALFARSDDPNRQTLRKKFQRGGVEILGRGAHVVVDGTHPDTGKPYYWPSESLWEIQVERLPVLTAAHEATILTRIQRLLGEKLAIPGPTQIATHAARSGPIAVGHRNEALFRMIKDQAASCDTEEELVEWARAWNKTQCATPLPDDEVVRTVRQVWQYKLSGRLLPSGSKPTALIRKDEYERLKDYPDRLSLYVCLQLNHGARSEPFALTAAKMTKTVGISVLRIRQARDGLLALRFIERVGGRGVLRDPFKYRFVR
jgi:hypothetical protein